MDSFSNQAKSQLYTVKLDQTLVPAHPGSLVRDHATEGVLAVGLVVDGKYKVIELVGQGGMGAVYRARHLQLDKDVALKTVQHAELNQSAWQRFQREVQAIARLNHPNVVQVFDFGVTTSGMPYYTMELLRGRALDELIGEAEDIELTQAMLLFIGVSHGLAAAHAKGIIHRDIKPANIFLEDGWRTGNNNSVKIVDFGIAALSAEPEGNPKLSGVGEIFGSPLYMSPEQFRGKAVSVASDIYSCGCALFELLTGRPPYLGDTASATIFMHMSHPVPLLSETLPGCEIPQRLDTLLASMLEKDPRSRPASLTAVADELTAIMLLQPRSSRTRAVAGSAPGGENQPQPETGNRVMAVVAVLWLIALGALAVYFLTPHERAKLDKVTTTPVTGTSLSTLIPKQVDDDEEKELLHRWIYDEPELPPTAMPAAIKKIESSSFDRTSEQDRKAHKRHFVFPAGLDLGVFVWSDNRRRLKARGDVVVPDNVSFEGSETVFTWPQVLTGFKPDSLLRFYMASNYKLRDRHFKYIARLNSLTYISTKGTNLTAESVPYLNKLTHLNEILLPNSGLSGEDLSHLSRLSQILTLDLNNTRNIRPVLAKLEKNSSLTSLSLEHCGLTNQDLQIIGRMKSLASLCLNENYEITDAGLAHLAALKELSGLYLLYCKISPESCRTLGQFHKLGNLLIDTSGWTEPQKQALRASLPAQVCIKGAIDRLP